jgi:hypothetical protein
VRSISYLPKYTTAATQYVELNDEDQAWLVAEINRVILEQGQIHPSNQDKREFDTLYWRKPAKSLPRGRQGVNTPETFATGLLHNLLYGTQRDFTLTQLESIAAIFNVYAQCWPSHNVEPIRLRVQLFDF